MIEKVKSKKLFIEYMTQQQRTIMVIGATSMIGDFLLPGLVDEGFQIQALSRTPPVAQTPTHTDRAENRPVAAIRWYSLDITHQNPKLPEGASTVIHLGPLWLLPPLIPCLAGLGIERLIAFGSTSLLTKMDSGSLSERQLAASLLEAETRIAADCNALGIHWTILRPTLVYHLGRDKNITTVARFIQRFRFFPLVGAGQGKRQPVHAEDLAIACTAMLDNPATYGKVYNLCGGETLCYRDMVARLFAHYKQPVRILNIPLSWFRAGLSLLSRLPRYNYLTPDMANRINQDMNFDATEAERDFGFKARKFLQ